MLPAALHEAADALRAQNLEGIDFPESAILDNANRVMAGLR